MKIEYGAMSSLYSVQAENKLTCYATMCSHFNTRAHLIAIYEPKECKEDSWLSMDGKVSERLDEVFGGNGSFDKYVNDHISEIRECYQTIIKIS